MTSYNDLVNPEVGNATNYGCHFELSVADAIPAIEALIKKHKQKTTTKIDNQSLLFGRNANRNCPSRIL